MKLSEAIRLGATLRPQARYTLLEETGSCALGAACEAVGIERSYLRVWPWLFQKMHHPVDGVMYFTAADIIISLNDFHGWTREAIADWVATVEPQEQEAAAAQAELAEVQA